MSIHAVEIARNHYTDGSASYSELEKECVQSVSVESFGEIDNCSHLLCINYLFLYV